MKKTLKLRAADIKCIVPSMGFCIATDMITVEGCRVGFMYREEPINDRDSGWRFLAGTESCEYMTDSLNSDVYSVNTIANYDKTIIPYLEAPYRTAWERDGDFKFIEVEFDEPEE